MKRISLVTICALAIAASVAARDAAVETFGRLSPGTALSAFPLRATRPAFDPSAPIVRIAAEDVEIAAETARIAALELGQKTAVVSAHVDLDPVSDTLWQKLETDDGVSWRLTIVSDGARFLRPHVTRIADERRPVLVYGEDARGDVREAFPTRTARRSDFWGPIAAGDMLHVEVLGGARPPRLAVDRVAHGLPKDGGAALELGCYLDPTCYAFWDEIKSGVAEIYYESWWGGSSCTGSLLDDLSHTGTPWFLTANHCMSTQDEADSVIIYWNFHTSVCNGAVPPHGSLPTSSGSDVMAENETSDFTLLKLDENPPGGTWFLGWSTDALAVNDPITVIHHPDAAWKRISFGHLVGSDANFWEVVYTESSTEGGSSGSPLFNENRQVIGQLWGGYALCTRMNDTDEFGKFGESWNRGISDFLGVTTTTTTSTTTTTVPDADDDADDDVDDDASDDDSASGDDDTADETKAVLTGPSGENDLDNNDGGGFCGC